LTIARGRLYTASIMRDPVFRDARPADADVVAALMHESSRNLYDYVFAGLDPVPFIRRDFVRGGGIFGYQHAVVAVDAGEVVGVQTAYPGRDYPRLMRQTVASAVLELGALRVARVAVRGRALGRLFVTPRRDALFLANACVDARRRGGGVYTGLMEAWPAPARRRGLAVVELDVSFRNVAAQRVFEHLGYRVVTERPYDGRGGLDGFRRMVCEVRAL
jgi:ribosomal protein S18 acetylase RimI-like enzyme